MKSLLVFATAAVVTASCGGGGGGYTLAATTACIDEAPRMSVHEGAELDYVIEDAPAGAAEVGVDGTTAEIAFGNSSADAARMKRQVEILAGAFAVPVEDLLERRGNTLIVWDSTPTEDQRRRLRDCIK